MCWLRKQSRRTEDSSLAIGVRDERFGRRDRQQIRRGSSGPQASISDADSEPQTEDGGPYPAVSVHDARLMRREG